MPHHSGAELPGAQALRQMAAQSDSRGLFSDRAPDPAYAGLFLNRELSWRNSTAACWPRRPTRRCRAMSG